MQWLGLDIGGANIKLADGEGFAESHAFALWAQPDQLTQQLRTLIAQAPPSDHLAITMTGELADCFETKADGVRGILAAIQEASDGRHTRVYLTNGTMVTPQVAMRHPLQVAAANWHALACFAGRLSGPHQALLIDIGSTTTDLICLTAGGPQTQGLTDTERLISGELMYAGVRRTPICAIVNQVPYRDGTSSIAREVFATMMDVYVILGDLPEDHGTGRTADGRPGTRAASRVRLGRMICADEEQFNHRDAVALAQAIRQAHMMLLCQGLRGALSRAVHPVETVLLSGEGEFLAREALDDLGLGARIISLSKTLGVAVSRCAPAHALAVLAREAYG